MLTALLLSLSFSASGDVEAVLSTPIATLDTPAKAKLAAAVLAVFPTADTSTVQKYYCRRDLANKDAAKHNNVICHGVYVKRLSNSDFVNLSVSGGVAKAVPGAPAGFVDTWKKAKDKTSVPASEGSVKTVEFISAVFAGVVLATVVDFGCERNQEDDTIITCRCAYLDTVSPATYVTLLHAGNVVKAIRRIP